jgi:hypothetical protein
LSNGALTDPYEISSVSIFAKPVNVSPSTVLDNNGEINATSVSGAVKMHFSNGPDYLTNTSSFDPSNFTPGVTASGIYKLRTGDYVVVLDGTVSLKGNLSSLVGYSSEISNTADAVENHIDVWTVRHVENSNPTTVINNFRLFSDNFVVLTEPILLEPHHKLGNKNIRLGETIDLKIFSDVTVENRNLDESLRNIFNQAVLADGMFLIEKINEEDGLPSHVTVSGYSDTSSTVEVTSDDTFIFNWDTNVLKNWSNDSGTEQGKREDIGSPRGTYSIQVKYTMLGETRISPRMYLQVN